jgi:hypothetical protein
MSQTDEEDQPWEQPGGFRRDGEPHRALFLVWLSTGACFLGYGGVCFPPFGVVGLVLGIAVLAMVRRDEALVARGQMDPGGRTDLYIAGSQARWAIGVSLVGLVVGGWLWSVFLARR